MDKKYFIEPSTKVAKLEKIVTLIHATKGTPTPRGW